MRDKQPIRVPLATNLTTREPLGVVTTTIYDTLLTNCYVEQKEEQGQKKLYTIKRHGFNTILTYNAGLATPGQGLTFFQGSLYAVANNTLWRVSGNANATADGTAWAASTSGPFTGRDRFGCIVFQNQIFVIGGENTAGLAFLNDVWSSVDGINWTQVASAAPWGARTEFDLAILGDTLYLMGGRGNGVAFNDVWSTKDGANWTQVVSAAPWSTRYGHKCVSYNQGIFLMGGLDGVTGAYLNDVWFTVDGKVWTKQVQNAAWGARNRFGLVVFNNTIWLFGGYNGASLNTVYNTTDGINWVNTGVLPAVRSDLSVVVYSNRIWLVGGNDNVGATTTVWTTTNGAAFTVVTAAYGGAAVMGAGLVNFTITTTQKFNTLWLIAGFGPAPRNSIFTATLNVPLPNSVAIGTGASAQTQYQFEQQNAGQYLVFKTPGDAWVWTAGTLQQITSPNYPKINTVPGVVNVDDTIYVMDFQGVIYGSNLSTPFDWSALNFITADYAADTGVALWKYQNFVVAFKSTTIQFFRDAGRFPGSPLLPITDANLNIGCASAGSIARMGNTLYFMATPGDKYGRYIGRFNGFQVERVSTPDVDRVLNNLLPDAFVYAYSFELDGHPFYLLTFKQGPTVTLVYDDLMKLWYIWNNGGLGYFGMTAYATDGIRDYFQDLANGIIRTPSPIQYQDDGVATSCVIQGPKADGGNNNWKSVVATTVIADRRTATAPNNILVQWSDDDGVTYNTGRTVDLSISRPRFTRSGRFRRRTYKLTHTSNNPLRLEALEIEVG